MTRTSRSNDWGFPRWRAYGSEREPVTVRMCDHHGCGLKGEHPAPKSSWSEDKWWFCATHVAEYNSRWDYFAGLDDATAARRAEEEARTANGFRRAAHWQWTGPGEDAGFSPAEISAYRVLELEPGADVDVVKSAFRALAKRFHPDINPDDPAALARFQAVTRAYELLKRRDIKD